MAEKEQTHSFDLADPAVRESFLLHRVEASTRLERGRIQSIESRGRPKINASDVIRRLHQSGKGGWHYALHAAGADLTVEDRVAGRNISTPSKIPISRTEFLDGEADGQNCKRFLSFATATTDPANSGLRPPSSSTGHRLPHGHHAQAIADALRCLWQRQVRDVTQ